MDTDLYLVVGLFFIVMSLPSIVNAYSEKRPPLVGTIVLIIGGLIVLLVFLQQSYTFNDMLLAITRVIGRFIY